LFTQKATEEAKKGLRNISCPETNRRYIIAAVATVVALVLQYYIAVVSEYPRYWRLANMPAIGIAIGLYGSAKAGI
jgi:hypothetical protein